MVLRILFLLFFSIAGYSLDSYGMPSMEETGYIILQEGKDITSQLVPINTTYVVRNNIDLKKRNITIPFNCILRFEGGKICNGSINLNMAYLDGMPQFENVSFVGNIKNGLFDCTWIEGGDIGYKINYAQKYFKRIYTPHCDFELSTPITLSNMEAIEMNGNFHYVGPIKNGGAAITIEKTSNTTVTIKSLRIDEERIDHTDTRSVNFIGISFTSCNNCLFKVDNVAFFNENIRFQDRYAVGCSSNRLICLHNQNANVGVRFYATDYNKKKSWANETVIQGGRFAKYGTTCKYGKKYGVFIGGPNCDPQTYSTGDVDTQDASSHITIEDASFDRFDYIAFAKNTKNLSIVRCREEEVTTSLCKFVGQCLGFYYLPGYINFINSIDLTECKRFDMNFSYKTIVDISSPETEVQNPKGLVFADNNHIHMKFVDSKYLFEKGVLLDTRTLKQFNVQPYEGEGTIGSVIVKMLSDDGQTILPMSAKKNNPVNNPGRYDAGWNGFMEGWTYVIPDNVNKVFVGICATVAPNLKSFVILSNQCQNITADDFSYGSFKNKPAKMQEGVGYYATDLHKVIYYDKNTSTWYDAAGKKM